VFARLTRAVDGGECLSKRHRNNDARPKWRCAKGHEWFATGPTSGGGLLRKWGELSLV
jgi:hypothetical protein